MTVEMRTEARAIGRLAGTDEKMRGEEMDETGEMMTGPTEGMIAEAGGTGITEAVPKGESLAEAGGMTGTET